jgi:hypothetical protein
MMVGGWRLRNRLEREQLVGAGVSLPRVDPWILRMKALSLDWSAPRVRTGSISSANGSTGSSLAKRIRVSTPNGAPIVICRNEISSSASVWGKWFALEFSSTGKMRFNAP